MSQGVTHGIKRNHRGGCYRRKGFFIIFDKDQQIYEVYTAYKMGEAVIVDTLEKAELLANQYTLEKRQL